MNSEDLRQQFRQGYHNLTTAFITNERNPRTFEMLKTLRTPKKMLQIDSLVIIDEYQKDFVQKLIRQETNIQ